MQYLRWLLLSGLLAITSSQNVLRNVQRQQFLRHANGVEQKPNGSVEDQKFWKRELAGHTSIPPEEYKLTVRMGDGDGTYPGGEEVKITADDPQDKFVKWVVVEGDPDIEDPTDPTTILTMPDEDVVIKATYEEDPKEYTLTVRLGDGDGDYPAGEEVKITADEPQDNFVKWVVVEGDPDIDDPTDPETTLTMPDEDVIVRATYKMSPRDYTLEVRNGDGDGEYPAGETVPIEADTPPEGEEFSEWVVLRGDPDIDDPKDPKTDLTMPAENVIVEALYTPIEYKLTVDNGSGDGNYPAGENVPVVADECPPGEEFAGWEVKKGDVKVRNPNLRRTIVTMPSEDARIEAVCEPVDYTLEVRRGDGDGTYPEGADVPVEADDPPENSQFVEWVVVEGNPDIEDPKDPNTVVTMPDENVVIEATYAPLYELTVINGDGDGFFSEGATAPIVADDPPRRQVFKGWVIVSGSPDIRQDTNPRTRLTMPAEDVTVEAVYEDIVYELEVEGGTGDGLYPTGERVPVTADPCPEGEEFERWEITKGNPIVTDDTAESTTVVMRDEDSKIVRICKDILYELIVINGAGDGLYPAGQRTTIEADEPPRGKEFDKWVVIKGGPEIRSPTKPNSNLVMPASDVTVAATYKDILYELEVEGGTGDGNYPSGERVPVDADPCPEGEEFDYWEVVSGNPIIEEPNNPGSTVIMTEGDAKIKAICKPSIYPLEVINGAGDGEYPEGEVVPIISIEPLPGTVFDKWIVLEGDPTIEDPLDPSTLLTMPGEPVVVEATYKPALYELTVENGEGSGTYPPGEIIPVTADTCPRRFEFEGWQVISGDPFIQDGEVPETTVTMPEGDATIRAVCKRVVLYTLTVLRGDGDGRYPADEVTPITADIPNVGVGEERFVRWEVREGNPGIDDVNADITDLTMPAEDVTVEAIYFNKCEQTNEDRSDALMEIFKGVSGEEPFEDPESPQSLAAQWMITRDEYYVCPGVNDKKIIQRYIMAVFYYSTDGPDWLTCFEGDATCGTNDNDFEGQKPYLAPVNECEWAGSTCDETLCITSIIFEENNNVQGTTPFELGDLEILEVISLEAQVIGGSLPAALAKPPRMRIIDFDFNRLTGSIPEEFYSIATLEQLDLNNNQLTGTLSNSIGGLQRMIFMQLHFNEFSGTIPPAIVDTPILVAEFQFNNFVGSMPLCIGAPGQTVGAISTDCGVESGAPVTCGADCGCECF